MATTLPICVTPGTWTSDSLAQRKASLTLVQTPNSFLLSTLADPHYSLLKSITVWIEQAENGFIASFREANINASGASKLEALENVTSLIVDVFEMLLKEKRLGPIPKQQLQVLNTFIREC